MDKKNNLSDYNLVMGFRQVMRGLAGNRIGCVTIACDIDEKMYSQLVTVCKDKGVPYNTAGTRKNVGEKLGLDVPCGVFAELLVESV